MQAADNLNANRLLETRGKPPGQDPQPHHPNLELSVTVSGSGDDLDCAKYMPLFFAWKLLFCGRGIIATERGGGPSIMSYMLKP